MITIIYFPTGRRVRNIRRTRPFGYRILERVELVGLFLSHVARHPLSSAIDMRTSLSYRSRMTPVIAATVATAATATTAATTSTPSSAALADKQVFTGATLSAHLTPRKPADPSAPTVLTLTEVASLLRVSHQTVYNLVRDNRLPAVKVGRGWRFPAHAVHTFLEGSAP